MSHPTGPSDSPKPVVKDKNPHNYRKVGYSLIVISVSLVLIGLLVLFIGNNYHFSGDIMAKQEIDAMTPKAGYNLVAFDYTQPIGAKILFLGHADTLDAAKKLRALHTPDYDGLKGQVLIFDTSIANNTQSVSLAEVYALTPTSGYDIVSFNTAMPVGARLAPQTLDASSGAAVNDSARYSTANVDPQIQILTFTSSFEDNLKQIFGASYDPIMASENINQIKLTPAKLVPPPPAPVVPANVTATTVVQNVTSVTPLVNSTTINATGKLAASTMNSTGTKSSTPTNSNSDNVAIADKATSSSNHTSTNNTKTVPPNHANSTKTVSLSENVTVTSTPK
jgi:hypothetical protein